MSEPQSKPLPSIGIVGIGLIGGSVGLALRNPGRSVVGCDSSKDAEATALRRGCVDRIGSIEEVGQCDVVFIGVPPTRVIEIAKKLEAVKRPETIVTDCSSVKSEIARWAEGEKLAHFIPGHPMAGHEKSGCEFASSWLFRNARWILTLNSKTSKTSTRAVEALIKEMGAIPVRLAAEDHDRHVGLLSHLPHVIAAALVLEADNLEHLEVGAGSWRDLTRVGGVDPKLWSQILFENRAELSSVLEQFQQELENARTLLAQSTPADLEAWLANAKSAKTRQMVDSAPPTLSKTVKRRRG